MRHWSLRLALLLLISACNLRGQDTAPSALPAAPDRPILTVAPEGATTAVTMYLPRWFEDDSLGLRGVSRSLPSNDLPRLLVEALIHGPNGEERAANFEYPFDPRTSVVAFRVDGARAV